MTISTVDSRLLIPLGEPTVVWDLDDDFYYFETPAYIYDNRLSVRRTLSYPERIVFSAPLAYTHTLRLATRKTLYKALYSPVTTPFDVKYLAYNRVSARKALKNALYSPVKERAGVSWGAVVHRVVSERSIRYSRWDAFYASKAISYLTGTRVSTPYAARYMVLAHCTASRSVSYYDYTRILYSASMHYSVVSVDRVALSANIKYLSVLATGVEVIPVEPIIIIGSELVYVSDMTVSADEGNFTYSCEASLVNYADFPKFLANTPFQVNIQGEIYEFVVDSRSLDRKEVAAPRATIRGLSKTSLLTGAKSKQIIGITIDTPMTASGIANALLYDPLINRSGYIPDITDLKWEILDWGLPAYRFGVENQYPLDSVKLLAEAVGGVVESTPEGDIRVRYKHPVAVPEYSDAKTDHFILDTDDILSIQERHSPNKKTDSIYVKTFQDIGVADTIEFFDVDAVGGDLGNFDDGKPAYSGGFVRVFPAIWRDTVELYTTNSTVELEYMGVEYWRPDEAVSPYFGWETIEIVRSQGSTKYPIHAVSTYGYLTEPAGSIIVQDYSKTFYTSSPTVRFSMVKLKYTTRCHLWKLRAPGGTRLQLCVRDTVFNSYLR